MKVQGLAALAPGEDRGGPMYWLRIVVAIATAALLVIAITDMLIGVFLRYVMSKITDLLDLPGVDFFWVEEIGEFALAWMTALGAALGIAHGTHFKLQVIIHRFPPRLQTAVARLSGLLMVVFGAVAAIYGWRVAVLNSAATSPGLAINLFWLYSSVVAGGALITLFGLCEAVRPRLTDPHLPVHMVE